MMAKKPKTDPRVWLPKRTSAYGRELNVAFQLVSRAAGAVTKGGSIDAVNIAVQALIVDGIASEFSGDTVIAPASATSVDACDADAKKAVVETINELGETFPCVNTFVPPYPDPVQATAVDEAGLGAAVEKGLFAGVSPRTWVLAPVTEAEQPAISLTLLDGGTPVMCAVALPNLPRNSMSGDKLLRMTVSFDGQSGAISPPDGTILWAEEGVGAYERSIGGEHGTDVRIRVDRSLLGGRNIAERRTAGVQDFAQVSRCEAKSQPRASALAKDLGMGEGAIGAKGPFAYALVARAEAQTYFDLPDSAADFDSNIWAHAAGVLLVHEAGGEVTDSAGSAINFAECRESTTLPKHIVGVIATNKDLHPSVVTQLGKTSLGAALEAN